mmetsp:Transcript_25041/g.70268  ORF Transcript_25041/g.70268 Transcript_25041/m.70268 type:complete len:207 (-) Transcript_25041:122-742(-)
MVRNGIRGVARLLLGVADCKVVSVSFGDTGRGVWLFSGDHDAGVVGIEVSVVDVAVVVAVAADFVSLVLLCQIVVAVVSGLAAAVLAALAARIAWRELGNEVEGHLGGCDWTLVFGQGRDDRLVGRRLDRDDRLRGSSLPVPGSRPSWILHERLQAQQSCGRCGRCPVLRRFVLCCAAVSHHYVLLVVSVSVPVSVRVHHHHGRHP